MPSPHEAAAAIWRAALAAADVAPLVARHLRVNGSALTAADLTLDLNRLQRILLLGVGKAAAAIARATEAILGGRVSDGVVVVDDGYRVDTAPLQGGPAGPPRVSGNGGDAGAVRRGGRSARRHRLRPHGAGPVHLR